MLTSFPEVECPCPPWFTEDSPAGGTSDWYNPTGSVYAPRCPYDLTLENEVDDFAGPGSQEYGSTVEYACPDGYALDLSGDGGRADRPTRMEWECATYALWAPQVQPRCVREYTKKCWLSYEGFF